MKKPKPVEWIGSSLDDLREFPEDVRRVMGFAINDAQNGEEHPGAKALKGLGAEACWKWSMTTTAIRIVGSIRFALQA
ncbi:hypothetical protein [Neorhizobium galegae]|uniref:hypothetical protein n=1 Tax=Neorhizobium galegae TaxID=399 RepID=UPI00062122B2|nr:Hypothetical protein NGAL_HAMBI2566_56540 [Neorhizobium galegae bv. orientalis]